MGLLFLLYDKTAAKRKFNNPTSSSSGEEESVNLELVYTKQR